ncbi:hypothetical protein CHGG_02905 [Chaetomium globosum CBS 148.51]|uniref:Guanine nucleotide-exchange factor SEC12 n=1 Tax=Chaetomium globosum (strain ATCC 6205 / CBS 148.51 / DSM 1962 / NBRC 6347 / NRRL 1970) TaxID=306901 RepID=Q2HA49_CHAGB|nr:uncharacterized protein CHGG_02905 [Chaetomium globosum CBS 148.51]EAQ90970.1 hypothetical protein CHGG_02905 [Chaetomium globosum CBS 148.51]
MAPAIPSAELRLSYPLYALDFDPEDANRLIVGGGGGAARSGVGNKVTVLDASHEGTLQIASEIELSRDEDSVNTLAVGSRRNNSLLFYTGINSAEGYRAGSAPPRQALSAAQKDAQIAIFDIPAATNNNPTPKLRGKVELPKEAMDMDIMQISEDEHQLVYCDDYTIYTVVISKTTTSGPHSVFTMPIEEAIGAKDRASFRSIRFLTPTFVLAAANVPKAGGAVLQGFRLPKPARPWAREEERKGKPGSLSQPTFQRDITRVTGKGRPETLPAGHHPPSSQATTQFAIAVTGPGQLHHAVHARPPIYRRHQPHLQPLPDHHPQGKSTSAPSPGLAFSPFTPPSKPSPTTTPHLKLASIGSMANTCIIHSLPLKPLPTTPTTTTKQSPRYILALASRRPSPRNLLLGSALVFALLALLLQGILEVRGASRPVIGARSFTPVTWHQPGRFYGVAPSVGGGVLAEYHDLASAAAVGGGGGKEVEKVVVLHHHVTEEEQEGVLRVEGHDEERHGPARGWEELE